MKAACVIRGLVAPLTKDIPPQNVRKNTNDVANREGVLTVVISDSSIGVRDIWGVWTEARREIGLVTKVGRPRDVAMCARHRTTGVGAIKANMSVWFLVSFVACLIKRN